MKKQKRVPHLRVDERRPAKPSAPPAGKPVAAGADDPELPTYPGPKKSDDGATRAKGATRKRKPDEEPVRRPRPRSTSATYEDQVPPRSRRRARSGDAREQYVRLRVRVRGDRLSIVDSHLVDGPLAQIRGFSTQNAYEVTAGDRLLHAGAVPDVGTQRSFPDPPGTPEQRGHHITERPIYEFMARVPADEITAETIPDIAVRLHRVKEQARADRLGAAPLGEQFAREVRPIAELVGLPESVLPEAIEARGGRTPTV